MMMMTDWVDGEERPRPWEIAQGEREEVEDPFVVTMLPELPGLDTMCPVPEPMAVDTPAHHHNYHPSSDWGTDSDLDAVLGLLAAGFQFLESKTLHNGKTELAWAATHLPPVRASDYTAQKDSCLVGAPYPIV